MVLQSKESLPRRRKVRQEAEYYYNFLASCLPLRSLRLRSEKAFILLRFFTAEKFCNLPARRNHMARLIAAA